MFMINDSPQLFLYECSPYPSIWNILKRGNAHNGSYLLMSSQILHPRHLPTKSMGKILYSLYSVSIEPQQNFHDRMENVIFWLG